MTPGGIPRVSAVSFLNTCPLVWGFLHGPQKGEFDLRFELPSACAKSLQDGVVDIGLVPVIEVFRQRLDIAADVCISSDGPVRSIFLLHRGPIKEIRTIALDSGSRTSVVLARIIMAECYGIRAKERELPPDATAMLATADAALIIGDPALRLQSGRGDFQLLDLGQEWKLLTGLPMVYAVWAGRPGAVTPTVSGVFRGSYEYGRSRIEEIVRQETSGRQVPAEFGRRYLTEHIQYELSARALQGLRQFEEFARIYNQGPN